MDFKQEDVKKLEPPKGRADYVWWADDLPRFGLRARDSGKGIVRTWVVQYRADGKSRRMKIGHVAFLSADAARKAAEKVLAKVTLDGDPQSDKATKRAKDKVTLGSQVENYLAFIERVPSQRTKRARRANTLREARHYLRDDWKPLHEKALHRIKRVDVAAHLQSMVTAGRAIPAERARMWLLAFFAWAIAAGLCDDNPVVGTNPTAGPSKRDRVLDDGELAEIWSACNSDDIGQYGIIIRLLILTACRRSEIADLKWRELDLDGAVIHLPATRTKNAQPHDVPLAPLAVSILRTVRRGDREHLFGQGERGYQGWTEAKEVLDRRIAEAREKAGNAEPMAHWTPHDLRRTAATVMAESPYDPASKQPRDPNKRYGLGVLPHVLEAVLNHMSGHKSGVAGIYNKATYEPEKRQALALWADYVAALVEGEERKLLPFRRA